MSLNCRASLLFPWTQGLWPVSLDSTLTELLWFLCHFHEVELYFSKTVDRRSVVWNHRTDVVNVDRYGGLSVP